MGSNSTRRLGQKVYLQLHLRQPGVQDLGDIQNLQQIEGESTTACYVFSYYPALIELQLTIPRFEPICGSDHALHISCIMRQLN